jgi:hypothetical protein
MANPFTEAAFFSQRNNVNSQANRRRADVDLQRRQFEAFEAPRAVEDFGFNVGQGRARVPNGMGRRGLLSSGIYRRALADFQRQAQLGAEDLQRGLSSRRSAFEMAIQDIEDQRRAAIDQLNLERTGSSMQAAALIRSILGGN